MEMLPGDDALAPLASGLPMEDRDHHLIEGGIFGQALL